MYYLAPFDLLRLAAIFFAMGYLTCDLRWAGSSTASIIRRHPWLLVALIVGPLILVKSILEP